MQDPDAFAEDWIDAFNSHDLNRILSHYAEDIELSSPRARQITGDPSGKVRGKSALRAYFGQALERLPDLRFTLDKVYPGADSVVLRIRASDGREGAELMVFGADGLVREVRAHWTAD